jgi:hypothetical protein
MNHATNLSWTRLGTLGQNSPAVPNVPVAAPRRDLGCTSAAVCSHPIMFYVIKKVVRNIPPSDTYELD